MEMAKRPPIKARMITVKSAHRGIVNFVFTVLSFLRVEWVSGAYTGVQ